MYILHHGLTRFSGRGGFPRILSVSSNLGTEKKGSAQPGVGGKGSHVASSVPGALCEAFQTSRLFLPLQAGSFAQLLKADTLFKISDCPKLWPQSGDQEYERIYSQFFLALLLQGARQDYSAVGPYVISTLRVGLGHVSLSSQ